MSEKDNINNLSRKYSRKQNDCGTISLHRETLIRADEMSKSILIIMLLVCAIVDGVRCGRHSAKKATDTAKFHRQALVGNEPLKQRHQKSANEHVKHVELQNCTGVVGEDTLKFFPKAHKITIRDSTVEKFNPGLNITELIVIKSKFPNLDKNFADRFPWIKTLVFLEDQVLIDVPSLKSCKNLTTLVASNVQLPSPHVTKEWFDGLSLLKQLSLTDDGIQSLGEDAFDSLNALVRLDLTNNNISSLENKVFSSLKKLKELGLYGNPIERINLDVFESQANSLKTLGVPWKAAEEIDTDELVNKLPKLKKVTFGRENFNQTSELKSFCSKLKEKRVNCKSESIFNVSQML